MKLGFGMRFGDLYEREGLIRLDQAFLRFLGEADTALHDRLAAARQSPAIPDESESDLLVALAPGRIGVRGGAARNRRVRRHAVRHVLRHAHERLQYSLA